MRFYLTIAHIIVAVLLVTAILLQPRSGGLSPVFGDAGGFYRTRRGLEKIIFWATIALSILFLGIALANIILA